VNQSISEAVLVREVGSDIVLLEPDITPLLVMTVNAKRKKKTISPRIEKIEDDLRQLWAFHNAAAISSAATAILVNDGTLFAVGDLVAVMRANASALAEEIMRVTAVASNTLTVTRGAGADTIAATNALRIIGSAYAENSVLSTMRSTDKTTIISYAQLFRTPYGISKTMEASEVYGEPEADVNERKAMMEHKKEIEASLLWGRASESLASPGSIWTTQGVKSRISTNVTDAGTTLTLRDFNDFSESVFRYGASTKLLIACPKVISAINFFAQSDLFTHSKDSVYGVNIQQLILPHGTLLLARNWLMENGISGQAGFADEAYVIDLGAVEYRYLAGNGKNLDTKIVRDQVKDGQHGFIHAVETQAGGVFSHEKRHGRLYQATDYA
jgi:hypothetical protein